MTRSGARAQKDGRFRRLASHQPRCPADPQERDPNWDELALLGKAPVIWLNLGVLPPG